MKTPLPTSIAHERLRETHPSEELDYRRVISDDELAALRERNAERAKAAARGLGERWLLWNTRQAEEA